LLAGLGRLNAPGSLPSLLPFSPVSGAGGTHSRSKTALFESGTCHRCPCSLSVSFYGPDLATVVMGPVLSVSISHDCVCNRVGEEEGA
jgi:hypothetical protein